MLLAVIRSEWYKLYKSNVAVFMSMLAGPIIALVIGITATYQVRVDGKEPLGINEWYMTLLEMNVFYSLLFLPLLTSVIVGLVCRYEHQAGGWKQLLAMPVTRSHVYIGKYAVVMMVIGAIQITYLGAVGLLKGYTDPFPMAIIWKAIIGGWIATMPLVALQLWLSIMWKSFAAPFTVNVIFTIPTLMVINSERFAPYYLWGQPFLMMYMSEPTDNLFFIPIEQLLIVVGGSFVLFFSIGWIYFLRKAI